MFLNNAASVLLFFVCCVVRQCFSDVREMHFRKFHMCPGSFPGGNNIAVRSKINCVGLCSFQDTCTACRYFSNGTCNLYSGDLTSQNCQTFETSGVHYKKIMTSPSKVCENDGILINGTTCKCRNGYLGDSCQRLMVDCSEGEFSGQYPIMSGFYLAKPTLATAPITIRCQSLVHHMALFRWMDDVNFNVSKGDYISGIGSATTDYWMGLENLHLITSNPYEYTLGVQVSNISNMPFYQHYYVGFKVKAASQGYAMTFTSHHNMTGTALPMGDCFSPLKDIPFSTYDNDKDGNSSRNCAADYGGGWWYSANCSECNLMGDLRPYALTREPGAVGEVFWLPGVPDGFSPASVAMLLFRL